MSTSTSNTPQQQSNGWKRLLVRGYQGATSIAKSTGRGLAWAGRGVAHGAAVAAKTASSGTMKALRVGGHLANGAYSIGAAMTRAGFYQGTRAVKSSYSKMSNVGAGIASVAKIIRKANAAIDSSNQIQFMAGISPSIRQEYRRVNPQVVTVAQKRFGEDALHDLDAFTSAAWNGTSGIKKFFGSLVTDPKAVMNTTAINAVTLLADRAKALMPDGDTQARTVVGEGIARELDYVLTEIEKCAQKVRQQGLDWNLPGFDVQFNAELAKSPLVQAQGSVNQFYQRLALRLRQELDNAIATAPNPQNAQMLKSLLDFIDWKSPTAIQDFLYEFLKNIHDDLCSPIRIKELLMDILDSTSESLEQNLDDYLQMLASPTPSTPAAAAPMDASYGHSLMAILQTLQPRALGTNILGVYAKFQGAKIAGGTDFLSVILRDATGKVIEKKMAPDTDRWIAAALKIARSKLVNAHGQFNSKPYYISDTEWVNLAKTPGAQQQAADPSSQLGQKYKKDYEAQVDYRFSLSTKRIAQSVLRSGFVADQFFESAKAKAANKSKAKAYRVFWSIIAFIVGLPVIKHILLALRQLNVRIRLLFADIGSKSAGNSINRRISAFLKTDAMQHVCMHMLERTLEHAHLLPTTSPVLGAGVAAPAPGMGPVPVAPMPGAAAVPVTSTTGTTTPAATTVASPVAAGATMPAATVPAAANTGATMPAATPVVATPGTTMPAAATVISPLVASAGATTSAAAALTAPVTGLASSAPAPSSLGGSALTSLGTPGSVPVMGTTSFVAAPSAPVAGLGAVTATSNPLTASPSAPVSTSSSPLLSAASQPLSHSAVTLPAAPPSPVPGQSPSLPTTPVSGALSSVSSMTHLPGMESGSASSLSVASASDDEIDVSDMDAAPSYVLPGTYTGQQAYTQFKRLLEEIYAPDKKFASDLMDAFFNRQGLTSFTLSDDGQYTLNFNEEKSTVLPKREGAVASLQNYRILMGKTISGWINHATHTLEFDPGCLRFHYYTSRSSLTSITCDPESPKAVKASFNSWTRKEQAYDKEAFLTTFQGLTS